MKIILSCDCQNREEYEGHKIEIQPNNFDFYINDDGLLVIECNKCNSRLRFNAE